MDRGYSWIICATSFWANFFVMTGVGTFGVLYSELLAHFSSSNAETAIIISLNNAFGAFTGILLGPIIQRFGCRPVAIVGSLIGAVGYGVCFFAQSIVHLCIGFGFLSGIANGLLFFSSTIILHRYFDKRRPLAAAVSSCGISVAPLLVPPATRWIIDNYGWRTVLISLSALFVQNVVGASLMRPPPDLQKTRAQNNEPNASDGSSKTASTSGCSLRSFFRSIQWFAKSIWISMDVTIFRDPRFPIFLIGSCITVFGYMVPLVFLPAYATSVGLDPSIGATLVSIVAGATIAGRIISGVVGDRIKFLRKRGRRVLQYSIPTILCGFSVASVYFAKDAASLIVYCIVVGLLTGSYVVAQQPVMVDLFGLDNLSKTLAFLLIFNGIASFFSQPFSGWLIDISGSFVPAFVVGGLIQSFGGFLLLILVFLGPMRTATDVRVESAVTQVTDNGDSHVDIKIETKDRINHENEATNVTNCTNKARNGITHVHEVSSEAYCENEVKSEALCESEGNNGKTYVSERTHVS